MFLKKYKTANLNARYTTESGEIKLEGNEIRDAFEDYISGKITRDEYSKKYYKFYNKINEFVNFKSEKGGKGAMGTAQIRLMEYVYDLAEIFKNNADL